MIWLRRTSSGDVTTACPAIMHVSGCGGPDLFTYLPRTSKYALSPLRIVITLCSGAQSHEQPSGDLCRVHQRQRDKGAFTFLGPCLTCLAHPGVGLLQAILEELYSGPEHMDPYVGGLLEGNVRQ